MKKEKRVALVIGNGKYDNASELDNPVNDSTAVASKLAGLGFKVISGEDLANRAFAGRVRDFWRELKDAHVALFFYAGHGLQVRGDNYVIPVDARLEHEADVGLELISMQTILSQMETDGRTSVVILDACRDNPLARSLKRAMGTRAADVGEGLGRVDAGIGSFIAFATAPGRTAADGASRHSPFTESLLKHMGVEDVPIWELMMRVRRDVIEATRRDVCGPQVPWEHSCLVAPFYFKRARGNGGETAPPTEGKSFDTGQVEHLYWLQVKDENAPELFEDFLRKFPDGVYALLAKRRLDALRAEEKRRAQEVDEGLRTGRIVRIMVGRAGGRDEACLIRPGSGESFKDFDEGPEMVVVPAGSFMMGSPDDEPQRDDNEGPQHRVTIAKPFAAGRFAVTRDEFELFARDSGRDMSGARVWDGKEWKHNSSASFRNPGFAQNGDHPVVCVNWEDAKAYVKWLSGRTGKIYRLLSEAEWEYAARAATATPFWWGKEITPKQANYDGNFVYKGGGSKGEYRQKTVPVKSFDPNPWGLHQVHGNVWEWTEDCWNKNYDGAPSDGSAWITGDCSLHVLRGGSWKLSSVSPRR